MGMSARGRTFPTRTVQMQITFRMYSEVKSVQEGCQHHVSISHWDRERRQNWYVTSNSNVGGRENKGKTKTKL